MSGANHLEDWDGCQRKSEVNTEDAEQPSAGGNAASGHGNSGNLVD
jgi:hypothetical protein